MLVVLVAEKLNTCYVKFSLNNCVLYRRRSVMLVVLVAEKLNTCYVKFSLNNCVFGKLSQVILLILMDNRSYPYIHFSLNLNTYFNYS